MYSQLLYQQDTFLYEQSKYTYGILPVIKNSFKFTVSHQIFGTLRADSFFPVKRVKSRLTYNLILMNSNGNLSASEIFSPLSSISLSPSS